MKPTAVTVVRVYLAEREGHLRAVLDCLRDAQGVDGWTVYRGVSGHGASGRDRGTSLADLALDLPVTVEFFADTPALEPVLDALGAVVPAGHIVSWPAERR